MTEKKSVMAVKTRERRQQSRRADQVVTARVEAELETHLRRPKVTQGLNAAKQ